MPSLETGDKELGWFVTCRKCVPIAPTENSSKLSYRIRTILSDSLAVAVREPIWLPNLRSKRCQIPPVGRRSTLDNVGSSRHAMWVARSPAEFVTNGRSPPIGSRQSSQWSVCCWDMRGAAVGMGQSSQEPSRVRHVVSLLGAEVFLAITKTSSRSTPIFSREQILVVSVPYCSSGAKHPAPGSVGDSMTMNSDTENGGLESFSEEVIRKLPLLPPSLGAW